MATILVAYDENRVIGNKNKIPWHMPDDLKLFKKRTLGHVVIMGRNTFESLPEKSRPLPGRTNVVLTSRLMQNEKDLFFFDNMHVALCVAQGMDIRNKVFVIGGEQVYKQALESEKVDTVIASIIPGIHEGDTFFPELLPDEWDVVSEDDHDGFKVITYKKLT